MKRLFALLLVLVLALGVFVGCNGKNTATLDDALVELDNMYKSMSGTEATEDFTLAGSVTVNDVTFPVVWSANSDKITVSKNADGNYTVSLPTENAEALTFVLTATVTDADNNAKVYSVTRTLPVIVAGGSNKPNPPAGDNNQGGNGGVETSVVLTVDSLGLPSDAYTAATATVGGVAFEFIQLGNYGDGIQMRDKDGKTSMLWNTSAFGTGIKRIELTYSSTKEVTHDNPDSVIYSFGNSADNLTYTTKLSTTIGTKTYTITPDKESYTFFKLEHDLGYSMYWESITIVYAGGNGGSTGGNNSGTTNPPAGDDNQGGNNSGTTNPPSTDGASVNLTVDSLGLPSQAYTGTADASANATVDGVVFEFIQLGNYGDGIQMRDKDGKTSILWNTSAFASGIKRIELTYSSTKEVTHDNPDAVIFSFGNSADNLTYTTKLSTTIGTTTYVITPDSESYTFFKLEHDLGYSMYWASIKIVLGGEAGSTGGNNPGTTNPPTGDDNQGGNNPGTTNPPTGDDNQGGNNSGTTNPPAGDNVSGTLSKVTSVATATPYYLWSENNVGSIYFAGSVVDALLVGSATNAVAVYLESAGAAGEYYIYYVTDSGNVYIGMDSSLGQNESKSIQFISSPDKGDDYVWLIDADAQTIISKATPARGIASRTDKDESVFHTYAISNFGTANYVAAWFVTTDTTNPPAGDDNQGGNNPGTTNPPAGDDNQGGTTVEGGYSYTFTKTTFDALGTETLGELEWTLDGNGGEYYGYEAARGQQIGSGNAPFSSITLTSEALTGVKEIVVVAAGASKINGTLIVSVGGTQVGMAETLTKDATSYTFTVPASADGEVVIEMIQTSSKAFYIKSIEIIFA